MKTNSAATSSQRASPPATSRRPSRSRWPSPRASVSSAPVMTRMFSVVSIRLTRYLDIVGPSAGFLTTTLTVRA